MAEAIEQKRWLIHPALPDDPARVAPAHQQLSQLNGSAVLTVPFAAGTRLLGALTLERPVARPFDRGAVEMAEAVAALAGPILDVLRRDDRWLVTKAIEAGRRQAAHLIGPRHLGLKLGVAVTAAVVAALVLATGEYRVAARAVMEADVRRVAVAPFAGYVREAPARAGDLVREGQLLVALDDRELRLERARWSAQHAQLVKQQHQALAARSAAQIAITAAQIDQARAQLALLDEQLAKSRVVARVDGVVVSGDLSQSLGSPVEKGEVLFQVAPLDAFRVVLQVDERDISDIAVGQRGQVLLAAAPDTSLAFAVEKITPVSTAREGRNYFRVEAALDRTPERLQPGMEGVGKITVDVRRLVWIWLRSLIDWGRLALWTWTP
jgi:multidrug efflux pump subunit AcrA (membrane-fusion protein)